MAVEFDPNCPDCRNGVCLYMVRLPTLRRTEARKGTRGRRGSRPVTLLGEECPWCNKRIPEGVSWCPECKAAVRMTLTNPEVLFELGE